MIIFIPGMGGSEIADGSGTRWGANTIANDVAQCIAFRTLEAPTPLSSAHPGALVQHSVATGIFDFAPQHHFVGRLSHVAAELGRPFETFTYDWRTSMADSALALRAFVAEHGAPEVSLVGHGFGGLVAAFYAAVLKGPVLDLITIGTPFAGTVATLKYLSSPVNAAIAHHAGFAVPKGAPWGAGTWASMHEVMPQPVSLAGDLSCVLDQSATNSGDPEDQLRPLTPRDVHACGGSGQAFEDALAVHRELRDALIEVPTRWSSISAVGQRTVNRMVFVDGQPQFGHTDEGYGSGDRSVLHSSAHLPTTPPRPLVQSHLGLLTDPSCSAIVEYILRDQQVPPTQGPGEAGPGGDISVPDIVLQGDDQEILTGPAFRCQIVHVASGEILHQVDVGPEASKLDFRFTQQGVHRVQLHTPTGIVEHFVIVIPQSAK